MLASTSIESPKTADQVEIPEEYTDLREVFSKAKDSGLPPHCTYDCANDLLPGTSPPHNRIYLLSCTEHAAMEAYGLGLSSRIYIVPSTSPASVGFFFVEKRGRVLHLCIDYCGLNQITVKYPYPLRHYSATSYLSRGEVGVHQDLLLGLRH